MCPYVSAGSTFSDTTSYHLSPKRTCDFGDSTYSNLTNMTLAYKPLMRGTYNPKILLDGCKPPSEGEFPMWEFLNKTKHLSNNSIISKCHVMK